MTATIESTESY